MRDFSENGPMCQPWHVFSLVADKVKKLLHDITLVVLKERYYFSDYIL